MPVKTTPAVKTARHASHREIDQMLADPRLAAAEGGVELSASDRVLATELTTRERSGHPSGNEAGPSHGGGSLSKNQSRASAIPGTITVPEAASLLGVSKSAAYRAIVARLAGDSGAWPTNVIRIGRTLCIPSRELRALLDRDPAA